MTMDVCEATEQACLAFGLFLGAIATFIAWRLTRLDWRNRHAKQIEGHDACKKCATWP
jgi:hypothetical protein